MNDLRDLTDAELADEAREREVQYQDAMGELMRRREAKEIPEWSEKDMAALLAMKREGIMGGGWQLNTDLPPPLFRMGYEWCALGVMHILEGILDHPSDMACVITEMKPIGNGLWRSTGKEKVSDSRRHAALDLLNLLDTWIAGSKRGMFLAFKKKRDYDPSQDQHLKLQRTGS